jgi:hypothetical protein
MTKAMILRGALAVTFNRVTFTDGTVDNFKGRWIELDSKTQEAYRLIAERLELVLSDPKFSES